jgi:hypothetical protein
MTTYRATAPERVKTLTPNGLEFMNLGDLRGYMDAKGFDLDVVAKLAHDGYFAPLFSELVLRIDNTDELLNQYGQALNIVAPTASQVYRGLDEQNGRIDSATANSGISIGTRRHGEGSATYFNPVRVSIPFALHSIPIAIVGYGAAGIMVYFALRRLGFQNITVYEKAKPLGIWGHENVYGLSRNNPLRLQFFGGVLEPAPGRGDEVKRFLERLEIARPRDARVTSIEPGKLTHTIRFADGSSAKYPIVINAMGLGKPKAISDPLRMTTVTGNKFAGIRWQYRLERAKVVGQRIILIGLGNSTAEMLRQIHTIIDQGYSVDYRVLTHYPRDAVQNPSDYIQEKDRIFRVFRDVSKPNLVDYQGDLAQSRYDYFRALHDGRIISDVTRWEVEAPGVMTIYGKNKKPMEGLPYDKVMTLIGYHRSAEMMRELGCSFDDETRSGVFDFDGEVVAVPGSASAQRRLHKGCFGFGSILETPHNPNAIVIPGMLHRIGDLLFGVVMRAAERRKKELLR